MEARPPSAGYRLRKFVRRFKGRLVVAGLLAAMLFVIAGLIVYGAWWADRQSAERRHEQALDAARKNDAVKATLDRVEAALKAGRVGEAGTLLGQADRQTEEQTPADLRERHGLLKKDERTVREFNDISEERWMISRSDTRLDNTRARRRYPPLFHSYGLAVGSESAAATAEKVRRSVIAGPLSSGLTEWFFVDPKYTGLLAVVDLLDPDPARARLRAAIANGDDARVKEVARTVDGSRLAPAYAIGLGTHPAVEDGLSILQAAWKTHPDSFALALTISLQMSWNDDWKAEALGWCRTAIALRPDNPLAHYHYAVALGSFSRAGDAKDKAATLDELRRTIALAPQFAKAHGRLAFILYDQALKEEAVAAARKAVALDDKTTSAQMVLHLCLLENRDYVGAARAYRQLGRVGGWESEAMTELSDLIMNARVVGGLSETFPSLLNGLIEVARPFEAYCLFLEPPAKYGRSGYGRGIEGIVDDNPDKSLHYPAACAAALAGTGQGLDAPPAAERDAIRKRAREWLTASFAEWKKHAAMPPVWSASIVGLAWPPVGGSPLPFAAALAALSGDLAAGPPTYYAVIHKGMKQWLRDPKLAGVREEEWLAKLPADEQEQWRKLWGEVRSLRDRTAPVKAAPPAAVGK